MKCIALLRTCTFSMESTLEICLWSSLKAVVLFVLCKNLELSAIIGGGGSLVMQEPELILTEGTCVLLMFGL